MKPLPNAISIADKYGPAMKITRQRIADDYFAACVEHTMAQACVQREQAEAIVRENIGYFAGYFDDATRRRVERLFCCEHPVFGAIAKTGPPTAEQALLAGISFGRGTKS